MLASLQWQDIVKERLCWLQAVRSRDWREGAGSEASVCFSLQWHCHQQPPPTPPTIVVIDTWISVMIISDTRK